mmetsp:Transcript_28064/g.53131  ORF Transcript_28064/g.53131 Transcript_28064/m.53131 type:complete len:265 (-) Transcript_28064:36-830(-)|eukprot:CAMPEP_0182499320 /NCGR_PEP_ID=MMETSP1321-20130603/7501_1 /TAXON_ID=91990 /ORGANISM="Bolidomonas sp., Strain RCC1657" /LENGTH=264 /DNA_ID=CAMNT_0024703495 /DNA_START=21 /DNA_END=815 /DNA_ORIENTATION=+
MAPSKKSGKKAPAKVSSTAKKVVDPIFPSRPRSNRIGGDVRPQGRDLSRFVKWPKYVRVQRQRAILYQRLKVPPVINQFTKALTKNEAATTFKLFDTYRPATPAQKKQKVKEAAAAKAAGGEKPKGVEHQLKFGLKHVTTLVEEKKAKFVAIACDVDPIELVVWLPALCRKMDVPFVIVKDKARLGALVHQKTAAVVALTGVEKSDQKTLDSLSSMAMEKYNNNVELVRKWGGGIMGLKTQAKLEKRAKQIEAEEAKKLKSQGL